MPVDQYAVAGMRLGKGEHACTIALQHKQVSCNIRPTEYKVTGVQPANRNSRKGGEVDVAIIGAPLTLKVDGKEDRKERSARVGVFHCDRVTVGEPLERKALDTVATEVDLLGARQSPPSRLLTRELELKLGEELLATIAYVTARRCAHAHKCGVGPKFNLAKSVVTGDGEQKVVSHGYSVTLMIDPFMMPNSPRVRRP